MYIFLLIYKCQSLPGCWLVCPFINQEVLSYLCNRFNYCVMIQSQLVRTLTSFLSSPIRFKNECRCNSCGEKLIELKFENICFGTGQAICKSLDKDIAECMGVSTSEIITGLVRLVFVKCVAVQLDAAHTLCRLLGGFSLHTE